MRTFIMEQSNTVKIGLMTRTLIEVALIAIRYTGLHNEIKFIIAKRALYARFPLVGCPGVSSWLDGQITRCFITNWTSINMFVSFAFVL